MCSILITLILLIVMNILLIEDRTYNEIRLFSSLTVIVSFLVGYIMRGI